MNGTLSPRTLTGDIWHETRGNVWEKASCSQPVAGQRVSWAGRARTCPCTDVVSEWQGRTPKRGRPESPGDWGLERRKRDQGLMPPGPGNDVQNAWPWFETVFGLFALGVSEPQGLQSLCRTLTTDKSRDHSVETI